MLNNDCMCVLMQNPPGGKRTEHEKALFDLALEAMGDVYASAIGTTVLQLKEIPTRPSQFDGALCLFGVRAGIDEAAVRAALRRFGEIASFVHRHCTTYHC